MASNHPRGFSTPRFPPPCGFPLPYGFSSPQGFLYPTVSSSATFWAQHLKLSERTLRIQNALSGPGEISQFLRTKLLEWLECLSLLDQLPGAVEAFEVLSSAADVSGVFLRLLQLLSD